MNNTKIISSTYPSIHSVQTESHLLEEIMKNQGTICSIPPETYAVLVEDTPAVNVNGEQICIDGGSIVKFLYASPDIACISWNTLCYDVAIQTKARPAKKIRMVREGKVKLLELLTTEKFTIPAGAVVEIASQHPDELCTQVLWNHEVFAVSDSIYYVEL